MTNGNATIIVGSARLGRSIVPFFQRVKSYFIQFITNRLPEGWWFDIEVLTTTGKSIFSS